MPDQPNVIQLGQHAPKPGDDQEVPASNINPYNTLALPNDGIAHPVVGIIDVGSPKTYVFLVQFVGRDTAGGVYSEFRRIIVEGGTVPVIRSDAANGAVVTTVGVITESSAIVGTNLVINMSNAAINNPVDLKTIVTEQFSP